MLVYKFLNPTYGLLNLSLRRLKVSRVSSLNDPFEILSPKLTNEETKKAIEKIKVKSDLLLGIISFSKDWQSPLLWSHYAEAHTGIALGFEVMNGYLDEVVYVKSRLKTEFNLDALQSTNAKDELLKFLTTKSKKWKYEQEYRRIEILENSYQESGTHYIDFSKTLELKKIILGIRCDLTADRIYKLVEREFPEVKVIKARMSKSNFSVVQDRVIKPSKVS